MTRAQLAALARWVDAVSYAVKAQPDLRAIDRRQVAEAFAAWLAALAETPEEDA